MLGGIRMLPIGPCSTAPPSARLGLPYRIPIFPTDVCVLLKGSHKWGLIKDAAGFANKDLRASEKRFSQGDRRWVEDAMCTLKAGQVSFHTGLTFHGSGPNRTEAPRLSIALNMMPGGTTYNKHGQG